MSYDLNSTTEDGDYPEPVQMNPVRDDILQEFVEKYYVPLKQANPKFPILIRECSEIQPRVWARYDYGKEASSSLANLKVEDVVKQVENISQRC